jgi:hypothetical protein
MSPMLWYVGSAGVGIYKTLSTSASTPSLSLLTLRIQLRAVLKIRAKAEVCV